MGSGVMGVWKVCGLKVKASVTSDQYINGERLVDEVCMSSDFEVV